MRNNQQIVVVVLTALMFLVLVILIAHRTQLKPDQLSYRYLPSSSGSDTFKKQRDELSSILNSVKHEIAIMSCEMNEMKNQTFSTELVSAAGGWCKQTSTKSGGKHLTDQALALELSSFFQGQKVASFGDGPGEYKKYLDSTHRLVIYDAYDGAPYGPQTSGGVVKFLDLTAPQYGLPVYDWIISLEVAEHIPAKYESIYVDNIVRHARVGIVLSWAVPGQGGTSHVNNKPWSYVKGVMSAKGFDVDMDASNVLQTKATLVWIKRNIYVYRRRNDSPVVPENA